MLFDDGLNIKNAIDFFGKNNFENKVPFFLLASPYMNDSFFVKTLIFIYEHSEKGSQGIILNKKSHLKLDHYNPLIKESIPIFKGGVIYAETPFVIHTNPNLDYSDELCDGVYMNEDIEKMDFNQWSGKEKESKVLMGVSQWRSGQLDQEIQNKNWFVLDFDLNFLFSSLPQGKIWLEGLRKLGKEYVILKNYTRKAYLN